MADDWVLVFDNVQNGLSIKAFWPAGEHGTIIVTTQLCDLDEITTYQIRVPPMSPEEGSELIRAHLRRGGSEAQQAESISKELGGLPLAITHFSGFVKRSQCPLEDILESLKQRKKLSEIWSQTDLTSTTGYSHTLETVWNLAFRRLTNDASVLIHIMSFLEPDHIPEEMFVGRKPPPKSCEWEYWSTHR
jgi:hypothetical protein